MNTVMESVSIIQPKLSLHVHLSYTTSIGNQTHQSLGDIFDFIVFMEKTNVSFDCRGWVIPKLGVNK